MSDLRTSTTTYSVQPECKHMNGWQQRVDHLIWYRIFFACWDCGKLLPKSKWKLR